MIEAHTIDAWTVSDAAVRASALYKVLQFIAGWAAPLFLLLAGMSVSLAAASHVRKGRSIGEASWLVQKRGWQVLLLAYLFRLQSFMLSPTATIAGLLKVDILNIMGVTMVMAAWCWARGRDARARAIWWVGPAVLCVILAQYAQLWAWPNLLGDRLQGYVRLIGANANFSLLPWGAFVFAGAWLGTLVGVARDASAERAFYIRMAAAGAMVFAASIAGMFLPALTPGSDFWTSSTSFFLLRMGAMLVMLSGAWWWQQRRASGTWQPMLVFGQTSLFVYWVHVEVVYGFPTYPLRHQLSIPAALVAYAVFTAFMYWLATLWQRRERGPIIPAVLKVSSAR
jgi:hypothetical protein